MILFLYGLSFGLIILAVILAYLYVALVNDNSKHDVLWKRK